MNIKAFFSYERFTTIASQRFREYQLLTQGNAKKPFKLLIIHFEDVRRMI